MQQVELARAEPFHGTVHEQILFEDLFWSRSEEEVVIDLARAERFNPIAVWPGARQVEGVLAWGNVKLAITCAGNQERLDGGGTGSAQLDRAIVARAQAVVSNLRRRRPFP